MESVYTTAINDTLKDGGTASDWLRRTLQSALAREDSPLAWAQDASRLNVLLSGLHLAVSAGEITLPVTQAVAQPATPVRNHFRVSIQQADCDLPDTEMMELTREEEDQIQGILSDMEEAEEIESFTMVECEAAALSHAEAVKWIAGLKTEDSGDDEDREYCEGAGCGALLEEGRIGKCDECMDAEHPDTDVHRSGCPSCQRVYDSQLPNASEVQA